MTEVRKLGVVLFQLGSPDSAEAVEPFLYNLFRDPDIIDFPFARLAREPLARLVANRRARKVASHYAHMAEHFGAVLGCASPLKEFTRRQAVALETELRRTGPARVVVAMRYWHPMIAEAIAEIEREGCNQVVLLPLYPQFSKTTTGSSLNEWNRVYRKNGNPVHVVRGFYDYRPYLEAQVERINEKLSAFSGSEAEGIHLLFSAHGIPVSCVEAGDPYRDQVEATTRLVMELGGWRYPHVVCYQSKVGPGRWLQPTLLGTLDDLGRRGVRNVLVVPISFVSDHIETLHEIAEEARDEAFSFGIRKFEMTEGLNDSPAFIRALTGLVRQAAYPAVVSTSR